jgi:hypothetical protein
MKDDQKEDIAAIVVCASIAGCVAILFCGCQSALDIGQSAYQTYEQIEADKEAARKADAERRAEEERHRVEAERIANLPPHWSAAAGAPEQLIPGAKYKVKRDGDGTWFFVYVGGHGTYKPESDTWFGENGIKAITVKTSGEYTPDGKLVKWFRMGEKTEPFQDGTIPPRDSPRYYHSDRYLKFRHAKASANGNIFRAFLTDGTVIEKTIIDREVRQE